VAVQLSKRAAGEAAGVKALVRMLVLGTGLLRFVLDLDIDQQCRQRRAASEAEWHNSQASPKLVNPPSRKPACF
jgi:hypothetical protein